MTNVLQISAKTKVFKAHPGETFDEKLKKEDLPC